MESRFTVRKILENEGDVQDNPNGYINFGYTAEQERDRKKSFVHLTKEALPREDHYKVGIEAMKRPSLGELHGEEKDFKDNDLQNEAESPTGGHGIKLGWIQGVLIPCLLNIWGVMLFLRLAWVVGEAGIGHSLLIIGISAVVCIITTTSMSAISTNGEVQGGGIYYIISRSLGPEFGASVGVVFAFANAVAASMNTIGFCNSLNDLLKENGVKIIDGGVNDVRIVGVIAILAMILICAVGMEWESKAQNVLIVIIVAAIVDFIAGCIVGPFNDQQRAEGFSGLSAERFQENWPPSYRYSEGSNQDFFTVFAIFFPSVTGIQAGANISGDLKDPAKSIPLGTMLALLISMISYAVFVLFAGASAFRDATGSLSDLAVGNFSNCSNIECAYGLANSYTIMQMMSLWRPLIYAGCFAATLSTALTNLLSVPRLIQALGIDQIYPGLIFFSKGYGKNQEAYRGYALTFLVSCAFLLIAELNAIAPLISNFYLASYALMNFCAFHAALIKPLGWRPTYKYYNMWVSLIGFFLCIGIMFLLDWLTSVITLLVIFILYLIVVYRKLDVNWGSSTQAQTYKTALSSAIKLINVSEHVKNYRPQVLVLCGKPSARPPLVDLAYMITKNNALLICGDIERKKLAYKSRRRRVQNGYSWLQDRKIKAFYTVIDEMNFEDGSRALIQATGIGKLVPNVLLMGFKSDWSTCPSEDLLSYFNALHEAFNKRVAVAILRVEGGLDFSSITDEDETTTTTNNENTVQTTFRLPTINHATSALSIKSLQSVESLKGLDCLPSESPQVTRKYTINEKKDNPKEILKNNKKKAFVDQVIEMSITKTGRGPPPNVLQQITYFSRKKEEGTIDVWWLYDDGGFTVLVPYIISNRSTWSNCKLRIFALANRKHELELEERNMASLLSKFRIDYQCIKMIEDVTEPCKIESKIFFKDLLTNFTEDKCSSGIEVTEDELKALEVKTNRHLRLRELLLEHSKQSSLIVMSLPMPRKGMVSAALYMAWVDALTRDMPPMILLRGNQSSVLTFYS